MKAVETENLSKIYTGGKRAVDGLNLALEPGEVFGFLGPNGAGKTTTVKLLNGMLTPTEGSCRVFGRDPAREPEKIHALAGVVTEHAQMYDKLTGMENLLFYGAVFGLEPGKCRKRAEALLEELELGEAAGRRLESYSTGMRQRLSLARALLHRPRVLFLDEPTSGLDPESAQRVNSLIGRLAREEEVTVFLCTHQLRYAQELCTRYGLIERGQLLAAGSLQQLRDQVSSGVTLRLRGKHFPRELAKNREGEEVYTLQVQNEEEIPRIVRKIVEAGGDIYHVSARRLSLEEIYFALTAKGKEESL